MSAQFEDGKDEGALRTIGEVSKALGIKTHVLRYWEQQFPMLEPLKRSGGRRYYRSEDVELIETIDRLVNHEGYTLKGAKKAIRDASTGEAKPADGREPATGSGANIPDFTGSADASSGAADGGTAETESNTVTSTPPFMTSADSSIAVDGGVDDFFGQPAKSEAQQDTASPAALAAASPQEPDDQQQAELPPLNMSESEAHDDALPRAEILAKLKVLRENLASALAA